MKFILNKCTLTIEDKEPVNSGSLSYYEAEVIHDEAWNDLAIEAVMVRGDEKGTSTAVINNKVYIDQNLEGWYSIGFVGYKLEEDKKVYQISTGLQTIAFDKGAGEIEIGIKEVPTPTEWEIYNAQIQEFIKEGQAVVDEAKNLNVELQDNVLTITKKDGTQYSENIRGEKGEKGDAGSVNFIIVNELPTENIDESAMYLKPSNNPLDENTYEEYFYVNGAWESLGSAKVEVNLADYVKNTDYATRNSYGVVKVDTFYGIDVGQAGSAGVIIPIWATKDNIKNKIQHRFLGLNNLDYAVKVGMTTNQEEWTDEEKTNARNLIGVGLATTGMPGLVTGTNTYGININGSGGLTCNVLTYNEYMSKISNAFISKGTLDNVLNNKHIVLTQEEYDALVTAGTVDENTFYYIKGE